jgi:hypothetical protein
MAKGRKALQALRELMGRPGDIKDALNELSHSLHGPSPLNPEGAYDDRGVAIVFVSQLEDALEGAVSTHFRSARKMRASYSLTRMGQSGTLPPRSPSATRLAFLVKK